MKRLLLVCLCLIVFLGLIPTASAQAQSFQIKQPIIAIFGLGEKTMTLEEEDAIYEKLKNDFFPVIVKVLTPEQRTLFKTALEEKGSIRKAFKKVPLTPRQKEQLSAAFKTISKDNILASLTPTQKIQLFIKKKELFRSSLEEIAEKISEEK